MPINPVIVENPYGLPPLNDDSEDGVSPEVAAARREMVLSIAENAKRPGADQAALARAMSAAAIAIPAADWKPAPEPLPISKKEMVRTILDSRERQLRALETFASDPKNPVTQDEVERIRGQIEAEAQRALANSTLPSPVAMYETLVEDESPEIYRARHKEMLLSLPGFNEKWMASVSFDPETNEPIYPKWMEKPLEAAIGKAMGVADDTQEKEARKAANEFALEQLKRQQPDKKDYEGDIAAYDAAMQEWENKMAVLFRRSNPEAAQYLPTFAEEQGFTQPAPAPSSAPAAPAAEPTFNPIEVEQLRMRFEATGVPATVVRTADELRSKIASGEITPDDVVIVSTPSGAIAAKLERNGRLRQVGRFSSRQ